MIKGSRPNVPRFLRRIALLIDFQAALPYLAMTSPCGVVPELMQMNRALEKGEKPSEFGLGSGLGCNPDDLRVELAGYWSRLLQRVKKQSEAVDQEQSPDEVRS